jgi:hypothetical protein
MNGDYARELAQSTRVIYDVPLVSCRGCGRTIADRDPVLVQRYPAPGLGESVHALCLPCAAPVIEDNRRVRATRVRSVLEDIRRRARGTSKSAAITNGTHEVQRLFTEMLLDAFEVEDMLERLTGDTDGGTR